MCQLKYKNGLLYADIKLVKENKNIYIDDVIIDLDDMTISKK